MPLTKNIIPVFTVLLASLLFFGCSKSDTITSLPAINNDNNKSVGAAANDLLSSSKYTSLKVEIQYMPGFAPDVNSVNNLTSFINANLNKSAGVSVTQAQVATGGKAVYSLDDLASLEKKYRTAYTTGTQLAMYLLVADGAYSDANVLGLAFRNTSIAIIGKTVNDNSGGIRQASRTKLETTVLEHELSHLLGLVDIGSGMQTNHKDAAHGNHCNNSNCLMYYASETTDITGFLVTGNIPALDANCKADIQANGGK